METAPRVLVRKTHATSRLKGCEARRSCARPKVAEERGGKGMQEIFLPRRLEGVLVAFAFVLPLGVDEPLEEEGKYGDIV